MRKTTLILLSATAITLAGCGKKAETPPVSADLNQDASMTSPLPALSPHQAFANTAAASDFFEIESSKLALERSSSATVKAFANQMIKAHTESSDKLKATAAMLSPAIMPDDTLGPDQRATLDSLTATEGTAFDGAYIAAQVGAHEKALEALKGYAATSDVPELKAIANELIPKVTAHLNMAKGLKP